MDELAALLARPELFGWLRDRDPDRREFDDGYYQRKAETFAALLMERLAPYFHEQTTNEGLICTHYNQYKWQCRERAADALRTITT